MPEEIKASTQYGDMRGTISIDGWNGLSTIGLGGACGQGYWPVGLSLYGEARTNGGDVDPTIYVLAVDESILDGKGADAVKRYARAHGQVPVFRFGSKLKLQDILPLIKRLDVEIHDRSTEDMPLMLTGGDTIYHDEEEYDSDLDDADDAESE